MGEIPKWENDILSGAGDKNGDAPPVQRQIDHEAIARIIALGDRIPTQSENTPIRIDESLKIDLTIGDHSLEIQKLSEGKKYIIRQSQRGTYHQFEIQDDITRHLQDIEKGKIPSPNSHINNGLSKIGLKIVRKDGVLSLEIIPDSPLAKLCE